MARAFNGTNQGFNLGSYDLRGATKLSISWWMKIDSYAGTQRRAIAHDDGTSDNRVFSMDIDGSAIGAGANTICVYFSTSGAAAYWGDSFPQVSTGVWHHFAWVMNRSAPSHKVWVDGVAQTMTAVFRDGGGYGQFDIHTLWLMNRFAGLWVPGSMAEMGVWGFDYQLTQVDVTQLALGASPAQVQMQTLIDYWPMFGSDLPEPGVMVSHKTAQLNAFSGSPTYVRPPGIRSLLAPGR